MKRPLIYISLIFSHVLVAAVVGLAVFIYDRIPDAPSSCGTDQKIISHNDLGDEIEMKQEVCGGIAYSDTVTLSVITKKNGEHAKFFSFASNGLSDPIVKWIANDALEVDIDTAEEIFTKKDHIGGIRILYSLAK
jgi:hypothetical protein